MRCNTKERQKSRNLNKIIIAGLVIVAIICRILGKVSSRYIYIIAGVLRTLIYIGLYIGWGISINKRVVQKAAKNTLLFISGLMIFWFIVRSIKYFFAMDVNVERYSWYSYYLPMLFIPQEDGSSSWTARRVYFTEMVKVVIYSYNALLLACFDK